MKRTALLTLAVVLSVLFFASSAQAQTTGNGQGKGVKTNWVDANGDGICDNVGTSAQGKMNSGKGFGKKDGTGNPLRPQDGTGFGAKNGNLTGTGVCDGSGPKGAAARRGGK